MKRAYMKPLTEIVNIALSGDVAQIVVASQTEISVNPDEEPVDPGQALSRRPANIWDEDDDDNDY